MTQHHSTAPTAPGDPFAGILQLDLQPSPGTTSSTAAAAAAAAASAPIAATLPTDPILDASPLLAAAFAPRDATNLLAVLSNQGLAPELRRSAAEELLTLSCVTTLAQPLLTPRALDTIWRLCCYR
jgi:hypothetical protein